MVTKRAMGLKYGAALVLPWALISAASAQTAPVPEPAAADEQPDIVVTAQKRSERLQDVPISISVLGGDRLDSQSTGGVTDALRNVAGLSITSTAQGGATQLTIRGVAAAGATLSGSSTAAYYIDSVPFGLVKSAILPDTNAYDMARVEVLRGPQGTLYGANSLAGVVRLITNDANPDKFELKTRAGLSTTDGGEMSYRGDLAVNIPLVPGKLALRVVAGAEEAGGWIDQPAQNKRNANDQQSRYFRAKLNAQLTDEFSVGLSAWISRIDQDAPNYADGNGNQSSPVPLPQTLNFDAYSAKLGYELPGVSISSATSYLEFTNLSQRDYTSLGAGQRLFTEIRSKVFTEELLLNSTGTGSLKWSVGGFYRDATDLLYQTLFVLPAPINTNDKSKSFAVFGQLTQSFMDDTIELTGGLRYFNDRVSQIELTPTTGNPAQVLAHKTETFEAITPRAVLTWLPSKTFTAYASYSQGFRSGFNQSPSVIRTAPDLPSVKADKLHNYEVGTKGSILDGRLSFDAALFYIKWNDIQQNLTLRYLGAPIAASVNGPSASGFGIDLSLTARPAPGFAIGGTYSWSGLKLDEQVVSNLVVLFNKGERLSFSPEHTASGFADYSFPLGGLEGRLEGSINYRSAIPARALVSGVSRLYVSDAPLTARAAFSLKSPANWTTTFFIDNITNDHSVLQPPSDISLFMRQRPRTVGLQFEFHL
ncbi:MAG: TonB-dependent receptor [Sphingomonas sp.]|jgi:outer membrane receptor protein involved in Fe transport|uniref:TonB-dependent receptor n=1 Tax=Sphingomonas sp. TaxID=28214 RepID=UPI0035660F8D